MSAAGHGGSKAGRRKHGERLYALATKRAGAQALKTLQAAFTHRVEAVPAATRSYYDTFDRRLGRADSILCVLEASGERELRLETLTGDLQRRLVTKTPLAFAADLPRGPFRDALEPLVEIRKLLPQAKVVGTARRLCVLSKGGKTTVRVALESWRARGAGATTPELLLLRVTPVRGYAKPARAVVRVLEKQLALEALPATALARMLGLDLPDEGTTRSWPPPIEAGMRADEAARVIYRGLLATMRANEAGTRARTDPEFLHEYRVALRRTRAGLARLKGLFPQRTTDRFKRDFAWLGAVTGPVRDMDVQLLEIPSYEADIGKQDRAQLQPLIAWVTAEGERAQRTLVAALDTARYKRLMEAWGVFLEKPAPARTRQPDAARPVEDLARERIWKLHRRIVRRGLAIDADTPAEAVHAVRLDAKKLRYLMEFFRRVFPAKAIKGQIAALKRLQEVLGRFNDFEVQQDKLKHAAASLSDDGKLPLEGVLVMGQLVETLRRRQDEARAEIEGRVAGFATPANLERAARLFAPRAQEQSA